MRVAIHHRHNGTTPLLLRDQLFHVVRRIAAIHSLSRRMHPLPMQQVRTGDGNDVREELVPRKILRRLHSLGESRPAREDVDHIFARPVLCTAGIVQQPITSAQHVAP